MFKNSDRDLVDVDDPSREAAAALGKPNSLIILTAVAALREALGDLDRRVGAGAEIDAARAPTDDPHRRRGVAAA